MINYTFLLVGLIYTTILPGFIIVEFFLPKLAFWKKIPLYLILSVTISCLFSYLASLFFGFTRETLLGCFSVFVFLLILLLFKRKISLNVDIKSNWQVILVGIFVYTIYFVSLYPAIFRFHDGYFVMGGPNWQDTAMHLSIIQSLTQGNFPPQAPYFSGHPLSYYYFSDFHAAIVGTFYGNFLPEVLDLLNPFLAMTFFFSVFALSYQISKNKILSIVSGTAAVLYGNMEFINFIKTILVDKMSYVSLVTSNPFNYSPELMQMTPMSDYFLQNRPMMVGLSAFVIVISLLLKSNKDSEKRYLIKVFVAGFITASLLKFQMFGFIVSWLFFGVFFGLHLLMKKINFLKILKYLFIFVLPSLVFFIVFNSSSVGTRSIFNVFLESFSWGPWQKNEPIWFVYFLIGNLGIGLLIYLLGIFFYKSWKNINILSIYLVSFVLIIIPLVMKFTLYEFDMFKFYYYLIPIICVLLAYFYSKSRHKRLAIIIFITISVFSSLTSLNLLVHSFLNKTQGYSYSDYNVGIWIRENTPQKSVFVTMPTVHSAPTDIGGRLRIISYINWPYSHGFNTGEDNVFSRVSDVENVYKTGDISLVKLKYQTSYVFYGGEERGEFPEAYKLFDSNKNLKLIYNRDETVIYEIL